MGDPSNLPQTQVAPTPAATGTPQSKKRKLDHGDFQKSSYFKIRSIIKDLRPFFLEVACAPDFKKCKAADEIRNRMKIMRELSKQLSESASPGKPEKLPEEQKLAGVSKEQPPEKLQEGQVVPSISDNVMEKVSKSNKIPSKSEKLPEKALQSDKVPTVSNKVPERSPEGKVAELKGLGKQKEGFQGTYVVGGSPIGWNFLVYPSDEPVYYGVTKADSLSRRAAKKIASSDLTS